MHTEPRSSVPSLPEHCRNWPPRRRLVTRHRSHFVKQRLRLATQTTIELVRIEKNGECKVAPKPSGMQHLLKSGTVGAADGARTSTKDSSATARIKPNEICCHWLEARLFGRLFWGEQPPLIPCSGVGGGHFLVTKSDHRYRPALRGRTNSAALYL